MLGFGVWLHKIGGWWGEADSFHRCALSPAKKKRLERWCELELTEGKHGAARAPWEGMNVPIVGSVLLRSAPTFTKLEPWCVQRPRFCLSRPQTESRTYF